SSADGGESKALATRLAAGAGCNPSSSDAGQCAKTLAGLGARRLPAGTGEPDLVQSGALGVRAALSGARGISGRPTRADVRRSIRLLQSAGGAAGAGTGRRLPARRSTPPTGLSPVGGIRSSSASTVAAGGPEP